MRSAAAIAALGVALCLAGGLFDAEPLFVGGVAFVVLAVGAVAWVAAAARGAQVRRIVDARQVVEEEPLAVRLVASARTSFPGGALEEPLLDAPAALPVGRRRLSMRIEVRFGRRGRRVLAAPRLILRDPLGLAARAVAGGDVDTVLVLPRTAPVALTVGGDPVKTGVARALTAAVDGTEIDGLRPYRPGAAAARIHWPAFARGAGLLERRLQPDGDGRPLVVLDARAPIDAAALDDAVRAAASLCLALARDGGCLIRLPGERRAARVERDLGAWPTVWARLALVEAHPSPPTGLQGHRGPVFYVAARGLAHVPAALRRLAGPAFVVLPAQAGAAPRGRAVLEVAGCQGFAVGRAIRSARAA